MVDKETYLKVLKEEKIKLLTEFYKPKEEGTGHFNTAASVLQYRIEQLEKEYPTIASGYKKIMKEQYELFAKKHLDYGMSNVAANTQLATEDEKQFALTGLFFRLNDKVSRWKNLIINKRTAQNEALTDTYQDITNYGIIAQMIDRDMWKK